MPEKARVFAAEDNADFLDNIDFVLDMAGHSLVLQATTLEEALAVIRTLPEHGIQVASVDGNLTKNVKTGSDGRQMVEAIRNFAPGVKIVGMSGESMENVDIDLGKDKIGELGKIVTAL